MPDDPVRPDEVAAEAALKRLIRVANDAVEAAKRVADPDRRYAIATLLVEALGTVMVAAARVRGGSAAQIRKAGNLSYAELAVRLRVNKARAEKLVKSAEGAAEKGEPGTAP